MWIASAALQVVGTRMTKIESYE